MTADVELLPLPEYLRCDYKVMPADSHEAECKHYARANLARLQAEIEALRAEVEKIQALRKHHRARHKSYKRRHADAEARAERLAEALRDLLSWFPEKPAPSEWRICAGEQGADDAIEYARAALHPTTAQEDKT